MPILFQQYFVSELRTVVFLCTYSYLYYLLQFAGKKNTALKADRSQQFLPLFIWLCFLVYSKYLTFVIHHKSFAIILKSLLNK